MPLIMMALDSQCCYADCHLYYVAIMLSVTSKFYMLSVIMLNVVMLNAVMLNVVMLNVIMLNVIMLNVVAPTPDTTGL
jgi:hypothetical protein